MLEETQKAPSTIAPTKTNAAHTANMLSFIVTFTRRTSIAITSIDNLAARRRFLKHRICCIAEEFLCATHFSVYRRGNVM
jgi:hypothetical protein